MSERGVAESDGHGQSTPMVDERPCASGGREFVRTVACAWCAGESLTLTVATVGVNREDIAVRTAYWCRGCERSTVVELSRSFGHRVTVRRM